MTAALSALRLHELFRAAKIRGSSDVHLQSGFEPVLRTDGTLEPVALGPVTSHDIDVFLRSILDDRSLEVLAARGDVTASYRNDELGSFRLHAYRSREGIALAVRVLSDLVPSLNDLHLPAVVARLAEQRAGLVLFAGPTGSGKSTAMAAFVDRINRTQHRHIVTVEDPTEYRHDPALSLVTQREVPRDVPDFASAVLGALRCDPDVLSIGEMRDPATMQAALTAAETGHLILATLHTGEASQTIDRVIGAFGGEAQEQIRIQLSQTLVAVVCLRLLRRACGRGRRAAAEVLVCTDAVRTLIRDGKTHQLRNVIATSRNAGMQTLEMHLSDLVADGEIDVETARAATHRPGEVRIPQERER